jgi:hypothetical protein
MTASLTSLVLDQIARNPGANADDILPHVPGYTRKQVMAALNFQTSKRRLRCEAQHPTGVTGSAPGRYFMVGRYVKEPEPTAVRPRNSVFDVGGA